MRAKLKWIIPLVLVAIAFSVYFSPVPRLPFEEIYARVSPVKTASLESFRQNHPLQTAEVDGEDWEYVAFGDGEETILFLHGMTGAYDIWWQQMEALQMITV